MEPIDRRMMLGAAGLAGVAAMTKLAGAGPLNPPAGPVGPTGQTLDDIYNRIARTDVGVAEPRIPVQSLPGSATALHVISEPGSYCLTNDIVGSSGMHGVAVESDDVSLHLGGFALRGSPSAISGVHVPKGVRRVHVVGGRIEGWSNAAGGGIGAFDAEQVHVERIIAESNTMGVLLGTNSAVTNCRGAKNLFSAFFLKPGSIVEDCVTLDNGSADPNVHGGVFFFFGGSIVRNLLSIGDRVGVRIEDTGTVSQCRFVNSQTWGVRCGTRVNICDNEFVSVENGIELFAQSVVARNAISGCNGNGIFVAGGAGSNRIEGNLLVEVFTGITIEAPSTRNLVTSNSVQTFGGAAYSLAPGTSHGPIVNVAGVGDISSVPGANHPWANFIY